MNALSLTILTLIPGPADDLADLLGGLDPTGPGAVICVIEVGEVVATHAAGRADVAGGVPLTADTPFYLASLAKPFVAQTALAVAGRGQLDLDESVRELFPELPETYADATLRHAIHHSSGIPDVYDTAIAADLGPDAVRDNASALALLVGLSRLSFAPGERFLYSNSGYVLLADSLERSTGKGLAHWAGELIFGPARMKTARFLGQDGPPMAKSYLRGVTGWKPRELTTGLSGPGGMIASAADLVAFESAWGNGTFGNEAARARLLEAPFPAHPRLGPYAAGWMLQRIEGLRVERHFGGAFGYSSDFRRFPEEEVTILALSNHPDLSASDLVEQAARIVLAPSLAANEAPRMAVALTAQDRAAFGRFWSEPESGHVWVLSPRSEGFLLASLGDLKIPLSAVAPDRLEAVGGNAPFAVELNGEQLHLIEEGRRTVLEALPFPPRELAPRAEVLGAYTNESLDARVEFIEGPNGSLVLRQERPLLALAPFQPLARDLYVCDTGAQVAFHRDAQGEVVGLTLDANRSWGLEFERE